MNAVKHVFSPILAPTIFRRLDSWIERVSETSSGIGTRDVMEKLAVTAWLGARCAFGAAAGIAGGFCVIAIVGLGLRIGVAVESTPATAGHIQQ